MRLVSPTCSPCANTKLDHTNRGVDTSNTLRHPSFMSSNKRPFNWLSLPAGSAGSNKRAKSPGAQGTSNNTPDPNQSANPHPTSSSANVSQRGNSSRGGTKDAGHAILATLKGSMRFLRESCGVFPPLKSVIETLLEVLESIEVRT